jgi:hypothetical protein
MWFPSGDQEHRLKYVVRGEFAKGAVTVVSSTKLLTWSCEVALGGGEVKRNILIVRSSLAVAKYLLAGSNVIPLT